MANILEQLMEVGDELAIARKGICYDLKLSNDAKTVTFYCAESSGEKYTIEKGYREIYLIWGIKARDMFNECKRSEAVDELKHNIYPKRIADTHGHYLFGVDDGAEALPFSLKMIKDSYDQGVRNIVCTSHDSANVLAYKRNFQLLEEWVKIIGLDVKLHQGCEIYCEEYYLSEIIEKIENGFLLPMGNSKYVLLEFAPWTTGEEVVECIRRIRRETEFKPIIAHIERYRWLFDDKQTITAIKEMDIPVQVNAYSIVEDSDEDRKTFVKQLLQEKIVTFIGSDAHGIGHRPVAVASGIEYIYENCDEEYANAICYRNAERMLF